MSIMGIDINTYTIDFYILDTNDPKTIILLDKSNYLFPPEKPRLFITPPGFTGDIDVEYLGQKNTIIEINSDSIGLTETCNYKQPFSDLEDGVWQIKMAVCPYEELYNKKCYLKTTQIDCRIEDILLKFDNCECVDDKDFKNRIIEIDILIRSARAEVNRCNVEGATTKFKKAVKLVNSLEKSVNCK